MRACVCQFQRLGIKYTIALLATAYIPRSADRPACHSGSELCPSGSGYPLAMQRTQSVSDEDRRARSLACDPMRAEQR